MFKAVSINAQAYTTFHGGSTNASDRSLKSNEQVVEQDECILLVKKVNALTYERNDMENGNRRIGFFANDFADNAPTSFNLTGKAQHCDKHGEREILTLDYSRLNCVLWTVCRNLLSRVEALEAQLS